MFPSYLAKSNIVGCLQFGFGGNKLGSALVSCNARADINRSRIVYYNEQVDKDMERIIDYRVEANDYRSGIISYDMKANNNTGPGGLPSGFGARCFWLRLSRPLFAMNTFVPLRDQARGGHEQLQMLGRQAT